MSKPNEITVWYRGLPYRLDLARCRRALVHRQIDGALENMTDLARIGGMSRSTASRFFSGRKTSLRVTLKILGALRLKFEDVATPVDARVTPPGSAFGFGSDPPTPTPIEAELMADGNEHDPGRFMRCE